VDQEDQHPTTIRNQELEANYSVFVKLRMTTLNFTFVVTNVVIGITEIVSGFRKLKEKIFQSLFVHLVNKNQLVMKCVSVANLMLTLSKLFLFSVLFI
jgi:hypothetical protein